MGGTLRSLLHALRDAAGDGPDTLDPRYFDVPSNYAIVSWSLHLGSAGDIFIGSDLQILNVDMIIFRILIFR